MNNQMFLGDGDSVFFMGVVSGRRSKLYKIAPHLWVYEQHNLDWASNKHTKEEDTKSKEGRKVEIVLGEIKGSKRVNMIKICHTYLINLSNNLKNISFQN